MALKAPVRFSTDLFASSVVLSAKRVLVLRNISRLMQLGFHSTGTYERGSFDLTLNEKIFDVLGIELNVQ